MYVKFVDFTVKRWTKDLSGSPQKRFHTNLTACLFSSELLVSGEPGLLDEELDYDENMDELDLYPTGSLDVGGGIEEGHTRRPSKSAAAAASGDEEGEERGWNSGV